MSASSAFFDLLVNVNTCLLVFIAVTCGFLATGDKCGIMFNVEYLPSAY